MSTVSTDQVNSSTQRGVYTPMASTIPLGGAGHEIFYIPTGVHTMQSTSLTSPESWALSSTPHPAPIPFHRSPSFMPATPGSPSQSVIPRPPSLSANPPDYTWVPQRQYALTAHHFIPADPILFNVDSGEPGIRLSAAYNRRFTHLRDRDDLVFESSRSPTISMRLEVRDLPRLAWTLADGA